MTNHKGSIPVYFTSLEIGNVRCFGKGHKLDITDDDGGPAQWTLILGENGVGKTTLLECLAWMRPETKTRETTVQVDEESDESARLLKGPIGPSLEGEEDDVLERLLRVGNQMELELMAELLQGRDFGCGDQDKKGRPDQKGKKIRTRIRIFYNKKKELKDIKRVGNTKIKENDNCYAPFIIAYGANRQLGSQNLTQDSPDDPIASRLSHVTELYDAEEILNTLDHAAAKKGTKSREQGHLEKVKQLIAKVLDIGDADNIKIFAPDIFGISSEPSGVRIKTFSGLVPLSALSLGYQTTLAWTVDLAWRLFREYPKSANPLTEPAIVLVDEIDLHLHPVWQLTIIDKLTQLFPRTQFIVTSHSPLMVQVAATANLAVVKQEGDEVKIENDPDVVRGWRVDQILTSGLFDVPYARDEYTERLFKERDELLDKSRLSRGEEARLKELQEQIANLPTAQNPEDQEAIKHIREAAALLKKYQVLKQ